MDSRLTHILGQIHTISSLFAAQLAEARVHMFKQWQVAVKPRHYY